MNKKLLFLLIFLSVKIFAQQAPRPQVNIEDLVNRLIPITSEDLNYEELIENLYVLVQNPLDINKAERADLAALFVLSERQINDILEHRKQFGRFLSLYELQSIPSLSLEDIRTLLPFIIINENLGDVSIKGLIGRATEHYLVLRMDQTLEESKGFREGKYAGSPQRFYTRYRLSRSKDFSIGFISEKDPGEKNFFDYTAFHIQLQNKGNLKNIVLGDYLLQFGQGLIFSGGYVAGKGAEPVYSTRRSNVGIRPYNSLIEGGSFRGLAGTYKLNNVEITAMASYNKRDASVSLSDESAESYFSSLLSAGMHRTEQEILNKNAIKEQNFGANLLYKVNHIQLGFSVLRTQFDKTFLKRDLLYNFHEFTGNTNTVFGPNISISWQNFNFFGEAGRSTSGGLGYVFGWVGSLGKQVEWAMNFRNYAPDFHTFYGNAFSEGSRTINEKGTYTGLKYTIKKGLEVTAFYDAFRFPWLRYRVDAPSSGHDYQLRVNYRPNKKFSTFVAYKAETKPRNESGSTQALRSLIDANRDSYVVNGEYNPNLFLKLQTRFQVNTFEMKEKTSGYAVMQDVEMRFKILQLKTRIAYFSTDNYDTRVYAFENDVLYAVSFPAYYGQGFRYYILGKVPLGKKLEFWARAAQTRVSDRDYMGSGNDKIDKNRKTDLRFQLKYKFN